MKVGRNTVRADKISYTQFWRFYKIYPDVPQATMRLEQKPGERTYFDYAADIDIIDPSSSEAKKTSLCCGVMAMSSYTYGEFTFTQKRDDLIRSMENAFRYFGGVTPYATVNNTDHRQELEKTAKSARPANKAC